MIPTNFSRLLRFAMGAALGTAAFAACSSSNDSPAGAGAADRDAALLGGATTVDDVTGNAFTLAARNLSSEHRNTFSLGDHLFNRSWVAAPAPGSANAGLGPTYNSPSCSTCHAKSGRGAPPATPDEPFVGILVRLSVPGVDAHGGPLEEPTYGGQLNPSGVGDVPGEGTPHVSYVERAASYADGEAYSLRVPTYTFDPLTFGPFAAGTMTSPRTAPILIGLGLLEGIPEATILAAADPNDDDHDGISGRASYVWDATLGKAALGRFGWKANQPTVRQQTAGAFLGDMGITSSLDPVENCTDAQTACKAAPSGGANGAPELTPETLDTVVLWARTVGVPARRNVTDVVALRGEAVFAEAHCNGCHTSKMVTGDVDGFPELSQQTIRPFTDLLVHDMGDDLADNRPDFGADGHEWRTAPLWGIGLVRTVSKHTFFLHDGRARDLAEAILWHGGEGSASRDAFRALPKSDRDALIAFLNSL